jgi:hypothetical protein
MPQIFKAHLSQTQLLSQEFQAEEGSPKIYQNNRKVSHYRINIPNNLTVIHIV